MSDLPERDGTAEDALDLRAAEYVLGLLDAAAAAAAAREVTRDPRFAEAVARWQARLEPLADTLTPAAPSARLWAAIETAVRKKESRGRGSRRWEFMTGALAGGIAAAAAALAILAVRPGLWRAGPPARVAANETRPVVAAPAPPVTVPAAPAPTAPAVTPPPAPPPSPSASAPARPTPAASAPATPAPARVEPTAVAVLNPPGSLEPAFRVAVLPDRRLLAVPLAPPPAGGGERVLWVWPGGQPAPVPLGLLTSAPSVFRYPYSAQDGVPVMVTRERAGSTAWPHPGITLAQGTLAMTR